MNSSGERGGTVRSLAEATHLQEEMKAAWSELVRQSILEALQIRGTYHADDLLALEIPADCKNIVGAQTNAIVRQRLMAETGERRSTSDPAGHGRRSAVYRITDLGREKLRPTNQDAGEDTLGGPETGSRAGGGDSQRQVATSSGRSVRPQGGGDTGSFSPQATAALPSLFSAEEFESELDTSHYRSDG